MDPRSSVRLNGFPILSSSPPSPTLAALELHFLCEVLSSIYLFILFSILPFPNALSSPPGTRLAFTRHKGKGSLKQVYLSLQCCLAVGVRKCPECICSCYTPVASLWLRQRHTTPDGGFLCLSGCCIIFPLTWAICHYCKIPAGTKIKMLMSK